MFVDFVRRERLLIVLGKGFSCVFVEMAFFVLVYFLG